MAEDRVRVLRVLEYVGSRSFVDRCLELRTVKGRYYPSRINIDLHDSDYIQEAILGETAEVLSRPTETTHECDPDRGCGLPAQSSEDSNV